ncbi:MAG: mandelate racemase/muconate lactonizing protein [uncultured bacterium]|nr:MAG: mandelate racemase/muconate lactonizing protein [uncultured bacterium]
MSINIIDLEVKDIRFPTSRELAGSDAMNIDPDYSAAYVILKTNQAGLEGHGLTFTIGRGNEICVAAINALKHLIVGSTLADITQQMGAWWRYFTISDSQLRWIGPEKGVIHLATAAVVNAVWDLWAKSVKKPLWQLLSDMTPEEIVRCVDFGYITDAITPDEAIALLQKNAPGKSERINYLLEHGYPAYSTSAGWLGYSDDKIKRLCQELVNAGWKYLKLKVGAHLADDIRRLHVVRDIVGPDFKIMIDANQKWDVNTAIEWMKQLAPFNPWWIEEPTSPDDVLGHATIRKNIHPIRVATGEHCQNRILFKQFFQAQAIDVCQIDSCRLGGVNEILAVLLMAAKFNIPVCPHAGGVGLCEHVQHLAMVDFICISASLENRVLEYVDHLHEHFFDPVKIKKGCYMPPTLPGYSITIKPASLAHYDFLRGAAWQLKCDA